MAMKKVFVAALFLTISVSALAQEPSHQQLMDRMATAQGRLHTILRWMARSQVKPDIADEEVRKRIDAYNAAAEALEKLGTTPSIIQ